MATPQRRYSPEFKREALALVTAERTVTEVARELGMSAKTLSMLGHRRAEADGRGRAAGGGWSGGSGRPPRGLAADCRVGAGERIPGESVRLLRQQNPVTPFYALVAKEADHYPVTLMCRVLGALPGQLLPLAYPADHAPLAPRPTTCRGDARPSWPRLPQAQQRVGRRPMRQLLAADGLVCSAGMVHTIMAEQQLVARRRRAWKRTTLRDRAARTAPHRQPLPGQRQASAASTATSPARSRWGISRSCPPRRGGSIWRW